MEDRPATTNREVLQQVAGGFEARIGFWCPLLLGRTLPLDCKHSAIIASIHTEPSLPAYRTSCPTKLMCPIRTGNRFNSPTLHGALSTQDQVLMSKKD